ncbi:uncharacterized protein LOC144911243 [Branchiostoma floridae x Branchiostoma belcheri]
MPVPIFRYDGDYIGMFGDRSIRARFVPCHPRIHHRDISSYLYHHPMLTDLDRRLLQEARDLNIDESAWVWEDAELVVYLSNMPLVLFSGYRTNKFVIFLSSMGEPTHKVDEKGWRLWIRDGLIGFWSLVTSAPRRLAQYVSNVTRLAIRGQ